MNIKHLIAAAALSATLAPALAADQLVDLSSGQATFASSAPVLAGGDDVITFANVAHGTYSFLLSLSAQSISGLGATLNGQAATVLNSGKFSFGHLESTDTTPFVLTLTGVANRGAVYTGEMTISAVPEPGTYAMLIAGLGAVGFVARRRSRA